MQTFGQGQHLGYLQLELDENNLSRVGYEGKLITVDSDALPADPRISAKLADFRAEHPEIFSEIGISEAYLARRYYRESDLGNLFADIVRSATGTEIGLMPSGALRKDLPKGPIRRVDLLDAFPFEDRLAKVTMSGSVLQEVVEQGLSLQRGMLQVSGLTVCYNPSAEALQRVVQIEILGKPLVDDAIYTLGTLEILAQSGDAYTQFNKASSIDLLDATCAQELAQFFEARPTVAMPSRGRINPAPCTDPGAL